MSAWPWQSYQIRGRLPPGETLRLLDRAIPGCSRFPAAIDASYFCGRIDVQSGEFELRRNLARKGRALFPVVRGAVHSAAEGSVVEVSVRPSLAFWLLLTPALGFLAFLPLGPLAWVLGTPMSGGQLAMFVAIPILGILISWWAWLPPLVVLSVCRSRYRSELTRILERTSHRDDDGGPCQSVEQKARSERHRKHSAKEAVRVAAGLVAMLGLMFASLGVSGMVSGKVTLHGGRRHRGDASYAVTLRGDQAIVTAQSLLSVGSGLIVCGVVGWRRARFANSPFVVRDLLIPPWPLLDTALLAGAVVLLVTAAGLGLRASLF